MNKLTNMTDTPNLFSVSTLLSETWKIYKKRFLILVGISLLPNIFSLPIQVLTTVYKTPSHMFLVLIIVGVFLIALAVWSQGALILAIRDNKQRSIFEYYKQSENKISALFTTSLIGIIILTLGLVLLIIPGIIFAMWFCFAIYIVMFEDKKFLEALKASKKLIKGFTFQVFVRWALLIFLYVILVVVIAMIFVNSGEIAITILMTIIGILATPFMVIYGYLMYNSLKIRNI